MKLHHLLEARRNPRMNPKLDPYQVIKQAMTQYDPSRLFVTFTAINKVGINPNSPYGTPLGIYAYPANFFVNAQSNELAFAGEQIARHLQLFTIDQSVRVFDIQKASQAECNNVLQRVKAIVQTKYNRSDIQVELSPYGKTVGQRTWYTIDSVCKALTKAPREDELEDEDDEYLDQDWDEDDDEFNQLNTGRKPGAMRANEIWRALGYDGAVDNGSSTIHHNEPTQAVFFSIKGIKVVGSVYNKIQGNPGATQTRGETYRDDFKNPYDPD